jgi:hypothetical protein
MVFPDLHSHVQQTFAELMGYDEHEQQLTLWCYAQRRAATERAKRWRWSHPEHKHAERVTAVARWQAVKRGHTCRRCSASPANQFHRVRGRLVPVVLCEAHLEWNRERSARQYEATKAAKTARKAA